LEKKRGHFERGKKKLKKEKKKHIKRKAQKKRYISTTETDKERGKRKTSQTSDLKKKRSGCIASRGQKTLSSREIQLRF